MLVQVGASRARPEHPELTQHCFCLRCLESSDSAAWVVHEEPAYEVTLIPETLRHHIVRGEEEPRIFDTASAHDNR
jgi:hypothetical protein